jgi:Kef-type K+ transport system membrane component KefB
MDPPSTTQVKVGLAPLGVLLLLFLAGVAIIAVTVLRRKAIERPLYLGLIVFGAAVMVAAVGLSLMAPWVEVVTRFSSGSSESE